MSGIKNKSSIDRKFVRIDNKFKRLEAKMDLKFAEVGDRFDKLENKILESEERIFGELQRWREDDEVHKFSHERINLEIEELQRKVAIV